MKQSAKDKASHWFYILFLHFRMFKMRMLWLFTYKRKHRVAAYTNINDIPLALKWGTLYKYDPPRDPVYHPTQIQKSLDEGRKIGDCLPKGTLLFRSDGNFIPIEEIQVGDKIHDGTSFVSVLKIYEPSCKQMLNFQLNNGCFLSCSEDHRLFKQDGKDFIADDAKVGIKLLQPDESFENGKLHLDTDVAFLLGAYLAEGWLDNNRICIAGVADGKQIREKCINICKSKKWDYSEHKRYVRIYVPKQNVLWNLVTFSSGERAFGKKLPHLDFDKETIKNIVDGLNADGGWGGRNKTTFVFSTTSPILCLQYRIMQRILGTSVHISKVDTHGGFGKNPIYRVTVRNSNKRVGAKIRSIELEEKNIEAFDLMTESGKIYLPEADVIVHNCDDHAIYWCASILKNKLAKRVWFCMYFFATEDNPMQGHAICVYEGHDGKMYWGDYGTPNPVEINSHLPAKFSWLQTAMQKYGAISITTGIMFEVPRLNWRDTPILRNPTIVSDKTITELLEK